MAELQTVSIALAKMKVRWEEPYTSQALNRQNTALPRGVYRGGILKEAASPDETFRLIVDDGTSLYTDTFFVYRDTTNLISLVVSDPSEVVFDMSGQFPLSGAVTWWVWADVDYTTGVITSGDFHVTDTAPSSADAIVFGTVVMAGSETDIQDSNFSLAARTYPVPAAKEDGVYVSGDEPYGLLSGAASWNIPTSDQKRAMNAASPAPTAANPFVTKAATVDKTVGNPTIETPTLTAQDRFQLSGWFYIGTGTAVEARKFFSVGLSTLAERPLLGVDKGIIDVAGILRSDGVTAVDPSVDADPEGFYENPYVLLDFTKTSSTDVTNPISCWCVKKSDFAGLPVAPASAFPIMAAERYHHAGVLQARDQTGSPQNWTSKTVDEVLGALLAWVNDRPGKALTEVITGAWTWNELLTVDTTPNAGTDVAAISATSKGIAHGVWGNAPGGGYGLIAQGKPGPSGTGEKPALRIIPQYQVPDSFDNGALWVYSVDDYLHAYLNGADSVVLTTAHPDAPKAYGRVSIAPGSPTLISGSKGIGTPVIQAGNTKIRVPWSTAFSSTGYVIEATCFWDHVCGVAAINVGYVDISFWDLSVGAIVDLSTTSAELFITARGAQ